MDPFILTIAGKFVLMALLVAGGVYQISRGYRLYQDGIGRNAEKATIQLWKFKANTSSTGALIMATASVWAVCAVYINPGVTKEADKWQVSYFSVPGAEVKSPTFAVAADKTQLDADKAKELLARAVEGMKGITINGRPADADLAALSTLKSESGLYLVTLPVHSETASALIAYLPEFKDEELLFVPAGVAPVKRLKMEFYSPKRHTEEGETSSTTGIK